MVSLNQMPINTRLRAIALLLLGATLILFGACQRLAPPKASPPPPPTAVLFIGNSFTDFNNGIDTALQGLASTITATRIAPGGYTLEIHWNQRKALERLQQTPWNYVVLQEQSQTPVFDQAKFRQFAQAFDREIQRQGAKTVLLMTWERPDSVIYGVTTANLATAYKTVGRELGAKVAPAGLAFERSRQQKPDLALYSDDGHPTIAGTYLAACVLYGTLFDRSPLGRPATAATIPRETQVYLQRIAAKTLGY